MKSLAPKTLLLSVIAFGALALAVAAGAQAAGHGPNPLTPTRFLDRPDGRIAYDDTGGAGPLVIAAPGMGDLRGEYRRLTPRLAAAGFRVVTLDVRGHGESSARWRDYSAHAVGKDMLALMDHLGARSAVVMGASFAAGSALWAAHDAPEKVRGVVMLSPMVRDLPTPFYADAAIAVGFAGPWRVSFWTWYWDSLFPLRKPADHDAYRAALAANLGEPGRMEALETMVKLSKADTEAILGRLRRPALLVMGSADKDFDDPAAEAKLLAARTGATPFIVRGAGHYPHVEAPQTVAPRLVGFLRTLP